jgi:hypothetical protein
MWESSTRLRLEPKDGSPVTDYRIQDGQVEVRVLDASGRPSAAGTWRRLMPDEIASHVRANTVVARWLRLKLGWREVLRKSAGFDYRTIDRAAA